MTDSLMESLNDTPTETPAQAAAIRAGWTITTVILGVVLLTSLIGMLLGGSGAGQIRFLLEAALCWNVYRGRGWARALLVLMLLGTGALLLSAGNPFSTVLGVVPLLGAAALCFVPQVNAYFRYASKM
ncbi:hypothetical protein GCM10008959_34880 [Deinococcus seoulensis]|uniref:Transmembrane protein n=1 Tax=Deinococcus seoulensis TaxID=1837379 RepID=A0ABQ2RZM5_9DEIO|nr:hypothetical protein [Deinococcus seoulensis]GGR70071.1 hypothetical protein GCM10008959_34880 [Deinococcus seoulensis]